ncbi:DUF2946 family protein [Phycisphaera mikurensis]|uniref:Secreted protein n=1 Tax=Phycisphaera mikurensis (strain NBRC 102666 / KCTC 22515 / FYK2301M01) TaxID=1142394 RepID=I0IJG0_PHYMF|nr:DUF2946 family protein [Phycisphaera mikurensis]MBB6443148.1 hypothetical protein [Phycisphaera mikurensis]BAM05398.1 hypothetical protein PSMK_p00360 [Phycisphaera mikurensis NBRC 102666]
MVLYTALFCACPTVAASMDVAKPVAQESCHGHGNSKQPGTSNQPGDTPQPHDHGGTCDCSGVAGVLQAPAAPTVAVPLPLPLPPVVASLLDRLLEEPPAEVVVTEDLNENQRPPGAGGSLLRQRCALNL